MIFFKIAITHLCDQVQRRICVEEVGHKGHVELLVALEHVVGRDKLPRTQLVRLLQHHLSSVEQIALLQRVQCHGRRQIAGRDLLQQVGVCEWVLYVRAIQVGDIGFLLRLSFCLCFHTTQTFGYKFFWVLGIDIWFGYKNFWVLGIGFGYIKLFSV